MPNHLRQINQVQTTEETISDPPGIDNTESTELQLNHINCESTDRESDTENTVSVNTINVQDDYETLRHEQPFHSHVYKQLTKQIQTPLVLITQKLLNYN